MPFKLDKSDRKVKQELVDKLAENRRDLDAALEIYNKAVEEAKEGLTAALDTLKESLDDARQFAADIGSQGDADYSDKSERWQEGDRGRAAREWVDSWENVDLSDPEIELPEELEFDFEDHSEILDQLPDEIDG